MLLLHFLKTADVDLYRYKTYVFPLINYLLI